MSQSDDNTNFSHIKANYSDIQIVKNTSKNKYNAIKLLQNIEIVFLFIELNRQKGKIMIFLAGERLWIQNCVYTWEIGTSKPLEKLRKNVYLDGLKDSPFTSLVTLCCGAIKTAATLEVTYEKAQKTMKKTIHFPRCLIHCWIHPSISLNFSYLKHQPYHKHHAHTRDYVSVVSNNKFVAKNRSIFACFLSSRHLVQWKLQKNDE